MPRRGPFSFSRDGFARRTDCVAKNPSQSQTPSAASGEGAGGEGTGRTPPPGDAERARHAVRLRKPAAPQCPPRPWSGSFFAPRSRQGKRGWGEWPNHSPNLFPPRPLRERGRGGEGTDRTPPPGDAERARHAVRLRKPAAPQCPPRPWSGSFFAPRSRQGKRGWGEWPNHSPNLFPPRPKRARGVRARKLRPPNRTGNSGLFVLQSHDAGQLAPFDHLQRGTASGGDVRDRAGKTRALHRRD